MKKPLLSYIVTVYNKEHSIVPTVQSLLNQTGDFNTEFIFVDDNSTDGSLAALENINDPRIHIIRNSTNRGPSIRLNQGAKASSGQFLQFMDSDDILVRGASAEMLRILQKEQADIIYGKWQHRTAPTDQLLEEVLSAGATYTVSSHPLHYVLTHRRIVRMVLMTTRECFEACGGCDEGIFIQDESLPIRLSWKAKCFVDFSGTIVFAPCANSGNLSNNKALQHYDAYLAYRHALTALDDIRPAERKLMAERSMSAAWKYFRRTKNGSYFSTVFANYLLSKTGLPIPSINYLNRLENMFTDPSIRRITPSAPAQE